MVLLVLTQVPGGSLALATNSRMLTGAQRTPACPTQALRSQETCLHLPSCPARLALHSVPRFPKQPEKKGHQASPGSPGIVALSQTYTILLSLPHPEDSVLCQAKLCHIHIYIYLPTSNLTGILIRQGCLDTGRHQGYAHKGKTM